MRFSLVCTALAALLLPAVASAGSVAFGCEAGLSVSNFSFEEAQNLPIPEDRYGSSTWVRGGVRARLPITSGFTLVGGISYEAGGERVDLRDVRVFVLEVVENGMATQRLEYLGLPLMVEYAIPTGSVLPFGCIGVEPAALIDADEFLTVNGDRVGDAADTDDKYPSMEWTLLLGGGVRLFDRWDVSAVYRYGLRNLNTSSNSADHPYHNRGVALGVTYWLQRIVT